MTDESKAKHIAIVGVGGVGTWAAQACALVVKGNPEAIAELGLFDPDKVEEKNLARVSLQGWVGDWKVNAVKSVLNTSIAVNTSTTPITSDNIAVQLAPYDTVICATDDVHSQRVIHQWCRKNNRTYQRAGYDGDTINVCRQIPLTFDIEAEKEDAGYHGVPECYHAIIAGVLAAYSVLRQPVTVMGEIAKLCVLESSQVPVKVAEAIEEGAKEQHQKDLEGDGWHDRDNCKIPEGYHSSEDCNYDDYIYAGGSNRETASNLSSDLIDYIIENNHECERPSIEEQLDDDPCNDDVKLMIEWLRSNHADKLDADYEDAHSDDETLPLTNVTGGRQI